MINFCLICRRAIVDQETSLFSAIDIVSVMIIQPPKPDQELPAELNVGLNLLVGWGKLTEPFGTVNARMRIKGTDGNYAGEEEFSFESTPNRMATTKLQIPKLAVSSAGEIRFLIEVFKDDDWELVGGCNLLIEIPEQKKIEDKAASD